MNKRILNCSAKGLGIALLASFMVATTSVSAQSESAHGQQIKNKTKSKTSNFDKAALNTIVSINIGDSIDVFNSAATEGGNAGVAYLNGEFWVSKWASDTLITMDSAGSVTSIFTIPNVTGVRSITTDGTSLFMGNAGTSIFAINPATKTLDSTITITGTTVGSRMCAYDPNADLGKGGFWIANFSSDVVLVSRKGVVLTTILATTHLVPAIYGGAVDTVTLGGPYLYLFNQGAPGASEQARVDFISIPSGTPTDIFYTVTPDIISTQTGIANPLAGGLFITDKYNNGVLQGFGIAQGAPDVLFGYDIVVPNCFNPTLLTATNATSTSVDLDWTTGGATTWNIEYGPVGFATGSGTKVSNITAKPYTLSGLTSGVQYEFRVEDSCSSTEISFWSVKSAPFSLVNPPTVNDFCAGAINLPVNGTCVPTTGIIGNNQSRAAITCGGFTGDADDDSWYMFVASSNYANITVDGGTSAYDAILEVFVGNDCNSITSIGCIDGSVSGIESANITGLSVGDTVFFRTYDFGVGKNGSFTVCVTDSTIVGLNDNVLANAVNAYPNPVRDYLTLDFGTEEITNIIIYDILGNNVDEFTNSQKQTVLNVSNYQNGTYFVKLISKNGVATKRIVVSK